MLLPPSRCAIHCVFSSWTMRVTRCPSDAKVSVRAIRDWKERHAEATR
jgi:hypothetical protein